MKPLNPTDSMFLWIEQRRQPMHVAGLHIFTPPAGAPEDYVHEIYLAWREHVVAQSPFNLRPVQKRGIWHWEEDDQFDVEYHMRHLSLPRPGRIRELLAIVSQLHGNLLDRNRPLWEVYLIEGLADGRFAMYAKIHHALVDGVTGAKMLAESLSTDAKEMKVPFWAQGFRKKKGPPPALPQSSKPFFEKLMQPVSEALQVGGEALPGIGSGLMDLFRANQFTGTSAMPFQAPPTIFNVPVTGSRRFVAQSYSLTRLKRIGKAVGATVNDVTLAVCASALRKYLQAHHALPPKPLIAMVPVSLHGETDKGGNQVGVILANLATHIVDPIERIRQIMLSTSDAKQRMAKMSRVEKLAHAAAMFAPMGPSMLTGRAKDKPMFNIVISNVPGPANSLYIRGSELDESYPVSIPMDYMALNITVSGYKDHLGFGYTACRRSVPALQRMVDYTDAAFEELEKVLNLTPPAASPATVKRAPAKIAKPTKTAKTVAAKATTPKTKAAPKKAAVEKKPAAAKKTVATKSPAAKKPAAEK